jgi:glutathione peroxidase
MKRATAVCLGVCLVLGALTGLPGWAEEEKKVSPVLDFKVKDIDGKEVYLGDYQGKVLLIVNVASKCGLTPQYEGLEQIYRRYKDKGFEILAFPANNFREQEPGSNEEIKEFCSSKYEVSFPLFSKISVKGEDQADLYKYLTDKEKNGKFEGDIEWNFQKFLIGKDGELLAKFSPRTEPLAPEVTGAIEEALKK